MAKPLTEEQKQRNRDRARQWRLDNPERYRVWHAAHYRENAEKIKDRVRAQRASLPVEVRQQRDRKRVELRRDQKREYDRAYRAANAEKIRLAKQAWLKTPEGRASHNANSARRRARLKRRDCGCANKDQLHQIWAYDDGQCYVCGAAATQFDHVVALASLGLHCVANLRVACARCNSMKNHRTLSYLIERLSDQGVALSPRLEVPNLPCPKALT